jgi:polysaccharide deacetylase family protein (PEP-CTERM system associated)
MKADEPSTLNAVSFDVEEYYHALNFRAVLESRSGPRPEGRVDVGARRIMEILAETSTRATFFVLGDVARSRADLVRELARSGHEIASHGMTHRTVLELGPERFREEAASSRKLLQDVSGQEVRGFRASTFSITHSTLWALDILLEEGYGYDSSIFPVRHDRYGIPSFPRHPVRVRENGGATLIEFPLLTLRLPFLNLPCGGGGYFRLFPAILTRLAIQRMNAASYPAVVYLHPWELDPGQPREKLGGLKTFRHYFNLEKTAGRLKSFLEGYAFGPLAELTAEPDRWPWYDSESC